MNRLRTTAVAAALLILGLAACGETASPSQQPSSAASGDARQDASAQPSAEGSAGASPMPPSGASDLEELIPDGVAGIPIQKSSMQGSDFLESGEADPETEAFLQDLGVDPEDIAVAFGFGVQDEESGIGVFVFRAAGAGTDRLVQVFKASNDVDRDLPLEWQTATVAGKQVERTTDPEEGDQEIYLYATGDVLFLVGAASADQAAELIAALP